MSPRLNFFRPLFNHTSAGNNFSYLKRTCVLSNLHFESTYLKICQTIINILYSLEQVLRHSWLSFESWTCRELFWLWYCYLPYLNRINLFGFLLQRGSWWRLLKGGTNLSKYGHAFNVVCLKPLDGTSSFLASIGLPHLSTNTVLQKLSHSILHFNFELFCSSSCPVNLQSL